MPGPTVRNTRKGLRPTRNRGRVLGNGPATTAPANTSSPQLRQEASQHRTYARNYRSKRQKTLNRLAKSTSLKYDIPKGLGTGRKTDPRQQSLSNYLELQRRRRTPTESVGGKSPLEGASHDELAQLVQDTIVTAGAGTGVKLGAKGLSIAVAKLLAKKGASEAATVAKGAGEVAATRSAKAAETARLNRAASPREGFKVRAAERRGASRGTPERRAPTPKKPKLKAVEKAPDEHAGMVLKNPAHPEDGWRLKVVKKAPEPKTTVARAKPVASKAAPQASAAAKAGRAAKTTGKIGKGVARQAMRPRTVIGGPFAAQVPAVLATGDPGEFKKALTGQGAFAKGLGKASSAAHGIGGLPGNALSDVLSLPAAVLPTAYQAARATKAAVEGKTSAHKGGSQGAMAEHEEPTFGDLLYDYKKTGFLPHVVKGDIAGAAKALEEHPVYSALEASGAYAVAGRGAGALARGVSDGRLGGTKRADLHHYGDVNEKRHYSANIITKGAQKAAEKRKSRKGKDPNQASSRQTKRYLQKRVDHFEATVEGTRRTNMQEALHEVGKTNPSRRKLVKKGDEHVVSEAAQGAIRSPNSFHKDIQTRIEHLKEADTPGALSRAERQANHALVANLERALKIKDPKRIDAIFKASETYGSKMADLEKELVDAGLLTKDQARKAAAIPYARTHMGASYGLPKGSAIETAKPQVLDARGNPLSLSQIEADMKANGMGDRQPAFLTHRQGFRGKGNFYQPFIKGRSGATEKARTGEAFSHGTFDSSWDAMLEQVAHASTAATRAKNFDSMLNSFGQRPKGGYFKDFNEARDAVRNPDRYGIDLGGQDWEPVRLTSVGSKASETARAKERTNVGELPQEVLNPGADPASIAERMMHVATQEVGDGPVVLMPKTAMDRFREHSQPAGTSMRAAQSLNSLFKGTVLPFSPRWIYGNIIDPWMRSALSGLTPLDWATGVRVAKAGKRVNPEGFKQFEQTSLGGTLFSAAQKQRVHRDASQFVNTKLEPFAKSITTVGNAPVVHNLVSVYRHYRDTVFHLNSKFFERSPQYAALGKAARKNVAETTGAWHKSIWLGEKALTDLAKGMDKTDNQIAFADSVFKTFGNWSRFGPAERRAMMSYAPFYSWAKASATLVYVTLPRHHPIKTAIITALAEATEKERQATGQSRDAKMALPPSLQGSLPGGFHLPLVGKVGEPGGVIPLQNLSSFGSWSNPLESATNFVAPQLNSITQALRGQDWNGQPLKDKYGRPASEQTRVTTAFGAIAGAFIPPLALYQNLERTDFSPRKFFAPVRPLNPGIADYLRRQKNRQNISVPLSDADKRKIKKASK